ncbi:hypothetical protein BKA70DRAFT_1251281 [Coprinopsis sp. MPI-PUGE-AT-0042]|nr:hypothetical protein BKA70DRAFT_1251281 [Coprinopsis sp. MPI-PUGE-AT-0042]
MKIKKIPAVYQYDHAHMVFMWEKRPDLWIKAGVELYNEDLIRSVVAPGIGGWSDWSVAPPIDSTDIVVLAEREKGDGPALHITINGQLVRGIMGVFAPENLAEVVWVGFGGARNEDVEETMDVEFEAFEVKLKGHSNIQL